jgi:hypothetical protein
MHVNKQIISKDKPLVLKQECSTSRKVAFYKPFIKVSGQHDPSLEKFRLLFKETNYKKYFNFKI